jgi:hypothetical protein
VAGVHELVGNALVVDGAKERSTDLRGNPIPAPAPVPAEVPRG